MAPIETKDTFEQLVAKQKEIQKVNPEQTWWVSVSGEDGWMSRSDGWVDPYTGNLIPRGHEMFHDDMIIHVIINDQQSFMATINSLSWLRSTYRLLDQH